MFLCLGRLQNNIMCELTTRGEERVDGGGGGGWFTCDSFLCNNIVKDSVSLIHSPVIQPVSL